MEPDQSGTEQTSPRGNDWEVVQLTASTYASAPVPGRSEPSDEEAEAKEYGKEGDDPAAALLMSGHFSVSQNEVQSLLKSTDSKERQEDLGSRDAIPNEGDDGDDKYQEKLKDGLDRIPSSDKGKSLPLLDVESGDGNTLQGMSLVREEHVGFSISSGDSATDAEKELSWSATESKTEKKTEEPTLQNLNPVTCSSNAVASGEQNRPDGSSRVPRDAWWRKQLVSLYKSAKGSNKLWPIIVAAAALMGIAYFRRRWQRGRLQLQQVKLQPSSSKERINHAVGPLNRIKDIFVAGNHPSPATHGHARLS